LSHVRDSIRLVSAEAAHHLPGWADDVDEAIVVAEEEAVGAGANAADIRDIESPIFVFDSDRAGLEEVERFPLSDTRHGRY